LALPSPEHELTDPMRGVTATVPPPEINQSDHPPTPGAIRKSRSFWHGTTDVETDFSKLSVSSARLATIEASPEVGGFPSRDGAVSIHQLENAPSIPVSAFKRIPHIATPPATSSPGLSGPSAAVDYFGTAHSETQDGNAGVIMSAPMLVRRVCLTRQTSSPLPVLTPREPIISGGRVVPDSSRVGRAAKEEQMYAELGYLAPPNPPDELERRRALYQYVP
jgi:hypothetical protein